MTIVEVYTGPPLQPDRMHDVNGPQFDTCVVIPTHPARGDGSDPRSLLGQALASVRAQTVWPMGISVAMDERREGAGPTRRRALEQALDLGTEFVSFLDSDDLWYPNHLEVHQQLVQHGRDGTGADVAYSWFDGNNPFPAHRGRVFDPQDAHHITMTITVRSAFARQVLDAFSIAPMHPDWTGEDWDFILRLAKLGARFAGTGDITWHYRVHLGNTSGHSNLGDATWAG